MALKELGGLVHLLVPGIALQVECLLLGGLGLMDGGQLGRAVQRLGHWSCLEGRCLSGLQLRACAVLCPLTRLHNQYTSADWDSRGQRVNADMLLPWQARAFRKLGRVMSLSDHLA